MAAIQRQLFELLGSGKTEEALQVIRTHSDLPINNTGRSQLYNFRVHLVHLAISAKYTQVALEIIRHPRFNYSDNYDEKLGYPINMAVTYKLPEVVEELLKLPSVDPNAENQGGKSPLEVAVQQQSPKIVRMLLDHPKTDVNRSDSCDVTPLYRAFNTETPEIVEVLLSSPDIDFEQTCKGVSYLALAIMFGTGKAVKEVYRRSSDEIRFGTDERMKKRPHELSEGTIHEKFFQSNGLLKFLRQRELGVTRG